MQRLFVYFAAILLVFPAIATSLHAQDAAEHLKNAAAWADKREYDKAIAECDHALALDPKSAEAYNTRGWIWDDEGEHDKAIADYNQALTLDPKLDKAYSNRADVWTSKGEYDKAIADCSEAIRLNPKNAMAHCGRAIAYEIKGEPDLAIADCTEAIRLDPKYATAYCERAIAYGNKGEHDKSITDWKRGLAITPDNWNLLNSFGVYLWKLAMEEDLKAAKAEVAGDLDAAKVYREKSVALKDNAKAQWNRGITANPTATDIHSNLGYAHSEAAVHAQAEGRLKDATELFDKAAWCLYRAVELKPISPRPHNNLGRVLLRQSQQFEAEAREAEAKGKTDPVAAARVKPLRDEAKTRLKDAIEQFERAVDLDPALLEARLNLGEVYIALSDRAKAEKNLDKAEKDLDKAADEYREILGVMDADTTKLSHACFGLARIAIARKKSDEAIDHLKQRAGTESAECRRHAIAGQPAVRAGGISRWREVSCEPVGHAARGAAARRGGPIRQAVRSRRQDQGGGAGLDVLRLDLCDRSRAPLARCRKRRWTCRSEW